MATEVAGRAAWLYEHVYICCVADKTLAWLGTSLSDVRAFPPEARRASGYQLRRVQQGLMPTDWKAMPPIGKGVMEIRLRGELEHRVVYRQVRRGSLHPPRLRQEESEDQ